MKTSEQINELTTALAKAQGEFTNPERNREVRVATKAGGEYRFSYSTLDCVMDMARPILAKHGLSITQPPTTRDGNVVVLTKLMHSSGQFQEEEIAITPETFGPQQIGSAISYMKRYAYCGMLGIASDEDDDGNAASGNEILESRKRAPKPPCPKCGKPDHVYEDRQKGGFFCWKTKGGCGHNWLPMEELPDFGGGPVEAKPPPKTKAAKVAEQHGLTTADKLVPPKTPTAYERALESIAGAVKTQNLELLVQIGQRVDARVLDGGLTKEQGTALDHELSTARKKIEAMQKEPVGA